VVPNDLALSILNFVLFAVCQVFSLEGRSNSKIHDSNLRTLTQFLGVYGSDYSQENSLKKTTDDFEATNQSIPFILSIY